MKVERWSRAINFKPVPRSQGCQCFRVVSSDQLAFAIFHVQNPYITQKLLEMSMALYPLASHQQIERTPSREDGIPVELEEDLRAYGCKLIQQAGILLKQ